MKSNQEQAKEFRKLYRLKSSESKPTRQYQCDLITEEYQEFIEAVCCSEVQISTRKNVLKS